jgi:hypothetical protein
MQDLFPCDRDAKEVWPMRCQVVYPARWGLIVALLNWPVPIVGPLPVVFLEIFALLNYPQIRFVALVVLGVTVVGVIRQGRLRVSMVGRKITVRNPWRSYSFVVGPTTSFGLDLIVYFPAQQVVTITQGKRRVWLVATGFLEPDAQEDFHRALKELSESTGCVTEVPPNWLTRKLW